MSVDELTYSAVDDPRHLPSTHDEGARRIRVTRLRGTVTWWCLAGAAVAAIGYAVGTVLAGRLAVAPSGRLVEWLALCVVGGAVLDTAGRVAWAGVVDRAEGR
ncbi:MAG: hypothetical protein ACRDTP_10525, partial [Mycobacteriales bacterium]